MRVAPTKVFTVGHSTHPIEEFIRMLENNGVQRVVDVRTFLALDGTLSLVNMRSA